ncbi:hypothetical protein TNCV_3617951 [Trichonephila clavipes]|nr:hypothetical protein TNCV_3617951 [Trichonephila clavipes]
MQKLGRALRNISTDSTLNRSDDLAISETWMEDSMPANVHGFHLRSYCNTVSADKLQLHHRWWYHYQVKAGGAETYIATLIALLICNRVNIDIS